MVVLATVGGTREDWKSGVTPFCILLYRISLCFSLRDVRDSQPVSERRG